MPSDVASQEREKRSRRLVFLLLFLAVTVAVILLLRGCPAEGGPFDYFRAKADELGGDPDKALAFVRDEVATLDYRGDVKGALGALWDGAGSPEEKRALLDAIWTHCEGGRGDASLDDVAPDRDAAGDAAPGVVYSLTLSHVRRTEEGEERTPVYDGPVSSLVGDVHSVSIPKAGTTRFEIRAKGAGRSVTLDVPTAGARGEMLVFEVERPGGEPLVLVRELWMSENRVGPSEAGIGDRHDFVVLPCRVSAWVREKEALILTESGRKDTPEARFYDGLLEFASGSDELLADIESEFDVRARFDLPRIIVLSTIGSGDAASHAIDLRQDYTSFAGDPADGYCAAHVRSLLESGVEHEWLAQWTGAETNSAFSTFNRLRDEYPDQPDRRVHAIHGSLTALREHGGPGARAVFRVKDSGAAEVTAVFTEAGIHLRGGRVQPAFAKALLAHEELSKLMLGGGSLDHVFTDGGDACAAVETALLGSAGDPSVRSDYVLEAQVLTGDETVLAPSARFGFEWGEGEELTRQSVQVTSLRRGLEYTFHIRRGLRTAKGNLTVERDAVAGATRHNPHYRSGTWTQTDATSFCVSEKIHGELAAGREVPFELLGRYERTDDPDAPRPVEWSGRLAPAGRGEIEVEVNGRPATLPVIKAKLVGEGAPTATITILDDPRWPVGRADALTSIVTSVRGRLVDENGIGIGGAFVQAGVVEGPSCVTWPDGGFRLPPPSEGEGHGSVRLLVKQMLADQTFEEEVPVDLSAAGLDDVEVRVKRVRMHVAWIAPDRIGELENLSIGVSEQVLRHVHRDLSAGRHVAIPTEMIPDGRVGVIAYYSYDPRTGHVVGVTEDGLHGSMANWYSYGKAAKKAADAAWAGKADFGAASPLHAMRGANAAMFLFASYRLRHTNAEEVAMRLLDEMEMWEERTNMFAQLEKGAGADARGKLADALGRASGVGGIDGDSAKASFYAGYIIATAFLHKKLD